MIFKTPLLSHLFIRGIKLSRLYGMIIFIQILQLIKIIVINICKINIQ